MLAYTLIMLQWDENYSFQPTTPATFYFGDRLEPSGQFATSWVPTTIVNNTLVAVASHVLRFNGGAWLREFHAFRWQSTGRVAAALRLWVELRDLDHRRHAANVAPPTADSVLSLRCRCGLRELDP